MKIKIMLLSACFICICNTFGMEEKLAKQLKRNNELLHVSIKQNHLIAQQNKYYRDSYSTDSKSSSSKAYEITQKLEKLYAKHNINVEKSSSSSED